MRAAAYVVQIGILCAVYFATASLGLLMDAVSGFATLVWPPTGIALAALMVFGYRLWPGIVLGAFLANLGAGAPAAVALGIACGNALEALAGAYLLRLLPGFDRSLERLQDVLGLLFLAAMLSTTLSASVGVLSLWTGDVVASSGVAETWRAWWLGDVMGDLVVAPLLLVWSVRAPLRIRRARVLELVGLGLALALTGLLIYGELGAFDTTLFFPVLLWAALRFGQRGVVTTAFVVTVIAVWGTALGHGPFAGAGLAQSLSRLQAFMAVSTAAFLILGAVMAERTQALAQARLAIGARDEFLSIASHELRNPLASLVLQLEALQRKVHKEAPEGLAATLSTHVDKAIKSTARMTALVENLLDVSRVTADRLQLELEPCDLAEVARELVERMSESASRAQCELQCRIEASIAGMWDRTRIEQVFENLLSNALRYAPGTPVEIAVSSTPTIATIAVRDRGCGISDSDVERVFDLFERAAPARHRGGLGLGLYITRQVVEAHGGAIRLGKAEGGGALFVVDLPRQPADRPAADPS